ncbi:hemerythrin domain-containing protein [Myceligenerans crystallogenes]|uniref:hemerythrin domain-containing protein n=1 Tax=Myceligenerans crystallogenes TaxID=316335 RepID=UPI0031D3A974
MAWSDELRGMHARLRKALTLTQEALASGEPVEVASHDLLLFCHGFCTALTGHHEGEDRVLFPAIAAEHPELRETLRKLEQDHSMIAYLISGLQAAVDAKASPGDLSRHLEGISAIMESHFRYEERQLLTVLETLALDAGPDVLGPL